MSNVIDLFGDKDLKDCGFFEFDGGAIGIAMNDRSMFLEPTDGGLIKIIIGHAELSVPRECMAEFFHVASIFVDSCGKYKPDERIELVCMN